MIRRARCIAVLLLIGLTVGVASAQDLNTVRADQIVRLKNYVLAAIQPSGLVRDSVVLNGSSFHPATPDAAGFALLSLSAFDHLNTIPDAAARVEQVLKAYAGQAPGVTPDRSADGHFIHFMNINTGAPAGGGWDASYTPIGTALLVAGAQFAANHFSDNPTIVSLADQLTHSVNFNNAIHPGLNGGIFLNMGKSGGGTGGTVSSWNEFMLVESLALREANNDRALAVKHRWLDTDFIPKRNFGTIPTLTDNASVFAPAFWVQQMHFFNGDFRSSESFETFFDNQRLADEAFSGNALPFGLGEAFRYGLTAGVSPQGYAVDSITNHPNNVFSPEAVAAWGDMDTLLQFYAAQSLPANDPRYKYGMVRVSATQPAWVPSDAGLVDHLFLLFGLVESLDPNFFADRVFAPIAAGDYNADGTVDLDDYALWRLKFGSTTHLAADGNSNGRIDTGDYTIWRDAYDHSVAGAALPEPGAFALFAPLLLVGRHRRTVKQLSTRCVTKAVTNPVRKTGSELRVCGVREKDSENGYESACNPCLAALESEAWVSFGREDSRSFRGVGSSHNSGCHEPLVVCFADAEATANVAGW